MTDVPSTVRPVIDHTRLDRSVREWLQAAVAAEGRPRTKAELGRMLDPPRSIQAVHQQLDLTNSSSMTLRTLSQYAAALGKDVEIRFVDE